MAAAAAGRRMRGHPNQEPVMNQTTLLRCFFGVAAAAAFALPASAQLVQNLVMANGTHTWGAPYWTENVPDGAAEAGVVDQLNIVYWLDIRSPEVVLSPGTYVAQMKLAKTVNTLGRFDLAIEARAGSTVLASTVLPAASQTLDTYVWSQEVLFTVQQPTSVLLAARNTSNSQQKQNYRFDTARIGLVPAGKAVQHESLDTWDFANPMWYDRYVAEAGATYGRVAQRNSLGGLTWLDLRRTRAMAAGSHVLNVRLRNVLGPVSNGAADLTFQAIDPVSLAVLASVNIPASMQTAGGWIVSPNLSLVLPAGQNVTFALFNHFVINGYGYQFDSFTVRSSEPSFTSYGAGCGGLTLAQTVDGRVGTTMTFQLGNGGTALVGVFAFGAPVASIPLDALGATGCLLHVTPDVLISAVFAGGSCGMSIAVPNVPSMFGLAVDLQGAALDPMAPGGLKTANAGQARIGL